MCAHPLTRLLPTLLLSPVGGEALPTYAPVGQLPPLLSFLVPRLVVEGWGGQRAINQLPPQQVHLEEAILTLPQAGSHKEKSWR